MSNKIQWAWHTRGDRDLPPLLLLHGFAGSRKTWFDLVPELAAHFRCVLVDLPGHGETPRPINPLSLWDLVDELAALIQKELGTAFICGYSMGGRVVLHLALKHPDIVRGLAVIGASPGIANEAERAARRKADQELAAKIRARGTKWFADYWSELPLFSSQKNLPPAKQEALRQTRESCEAENLAFGLENFGTGEQDDLLPRIAQLHCPLFLMAGALDTKFCALNKEIEKVATSARVRRVEIPHAGHAAHIENPFAVAREIIAFFTQQDKPS